MRLGGCFGGMAAGGTVLLVAAVAFADSSPREDQRFPPGAMPPIEAPRNVRKDAAPIVVVTADARVESSELGYGRGIAPALGRTVSWQGSPCIVIDVAADDGGPIFSAGTRHVITVEGGRLMVALKFVDPDSTVQMGTPVATLRQ